MTETEEAYLTASLAAIEATLLKIYTSGVASSGLGARNWTVLDIDKLEKMRKQYQDRLAGKGTIFTNHAIIL